MRWQGRRGWVILGPAEDRVARYLEGATRHGRVTLPTRVVMARANVGRSEAYRITARLRELGLFGIENDQGGAHGGRRYWRTAVVRSDVQELDPLRHRAAWARIAGWLRRFARRIRAATPAVILPSRPTRIPAGAVAAHTAPAGPPFREAMIRAGLAPALVAAWGLER